MATPPKQKFCANPHPLIPLYPASTACPHSPVFLTTEHHDSPCSTAQRSSVYLITIDFQCFYGLKQIVIILSSLQSRTVS